MSMIENLSTAANKPTARGTLEVGPQEHPILGRVGALPQALLALPRVIVVCGHYGVGKTNLSMNMALDYVAEGKHVCLIDLDVVNPYFRSSDYPHVLEQAGVDLLAPEFSQSALDAPMLSGRIGTEIGLAQNDENRVLIIDVGGDDVGATALGSYSDAMQAGPYAMLYVVNAFREQTIDPQEAIQLLPEIEYQAKCKATAVVNNSHLQSETTSADIDHGIAYAHTVAEQLKVPLLCNAIPVNVKNSVNDSVLSDASTYFVRRLVTTPWDA